MNSKQHIEKRIKRSKECFKNVCESIGEIKKGMSLFGVTRGQFSMIDIINYVVKNSDGQCDITLWTWCIADYEIRCIETLMGNKKINNALLVIDTSARKRNGSLLKKWTDIFGDESIRYVVNHSKIATIKTKTEEFLIRGSMNLNNNPRFEQFDIDEGHSGFDVVKNIESELPILRINHENKDARKASKINKCWTQQELLPFGDLKTWAK